MAPVLTTGSSVQCSHGGQALLLTTNSVLFAGDEAVLLESDVHPIVGCSFVVGTVYMPCVLVQWDGGASSLTVDGVGVLTTDSVGSCLNGSGIEQSVALVDAAAPQLDAT
jgi:hypothetical protein